MTTKPRPAHIVLGVSVLTLIASAIWFIGAGLGQSTATDSAQLETTGASRANAEGNTTSSDTTQQSAAQQSAATTPRIGQVVPEREVITGSPPIGLEIPALDLVSEVVPVGVDSDRQVVIPEDIAQVGWYRFGATPGTGLGSSVIVGHRDGRNFGIGAFYDLDRLNVGDPVSVTNEAGELVSYEVTGVESIKKTKLPMRELFRETGPETLTLISCIGFYEPGVGYEANIIVSAKPVLSDSNPATDSPKS